MLGLSGGKAKQGPTLGSFSKHRDHYQAPKDHGDGCPWQSPARSRIYGAVSCRSRPGCLKHWDWSSSVFQLHPAQRSWLPSWVMDGAWCGTQNLGISHPSDDVCTPGCKPCLAAHLCMSPMDLGPGAASLPAPGLAFWRAVAPSGPATRGRIRPWPPCTAGTPLPSLPPDHVYSQTSDSLIFPFKKTIKVIQPH